MRYWFIFIFNLVVLTVLVRLLAVYDHVEEGIAEYGVRAGVGEGFGGYPETLH